MEKRYQVFVSSTYADLKEERGRVIQTLMELDCIPSGMELFPAMDEEQLEFIKRVIDDCDYYILIIGGRYGSITPEGVSYTEKEYDYAIERKIKVLAFLHEKPGEISVDKSEVDPELRVRLERFRKKASTGRLVKFWTKAEELPGLVALSLTKTIKTYPAIGWVRANHIANVDALGELNELRKINEEQEKKLKGFYDEQNAISDLIKLEKQIDLTVVIDKPINIVGHEVSNTINPPNINTYSINISLRELFSLVGSELLLRHVSTTETKEIIELFLKKKGFYDGSDTLSISNHDCNTILVQFLTFGLILIKERYANTKHLYLTAKGEKTLMHICN